MVVRVPTNVEEINSTVKHLKNNNESNRFDHLYTHLLINIVLMIRVFPISLNKRFRYMSRFITVPQTEN